MNDNIRISLDTGLYNAGVLGLIKLLELTGEKKGESWYIDGQDLIASRQFFLREDLSSLYLDMIFNYYEKSSVFNRFISTPFDTCDEKTLYSFDTVFSGKTKSTICGIYNGEEFDEISSEFAKITKKEPEKKRIQAKKVQAYLIENKTLYKYLVTGDAARAQLSNYFSGFGFLGIAQGSYYIKKGVKFESGLDDFLFRLLREYIGEYDTHLHDDEIKCIQCRELGAKASKYLIEMKFLNGFIDDPAKKKSAIWNMQSDAWLCPVCAFIYFLMPFGFVEMNKGGYLKDYVFVNINDSVELLQRNNESLEIESNNNTLDRKQVINTVIAQQLKTKSENELDNIEVIIRQNKGKRSFYSYDIIGKDILTVIHNAENNLNAITSTVIKKPDGEFIRIFEEVLENILSYKNQWTLLDKLLRLDAGTYALNNVYDIQIKQSIKEETMKEIEGKIRSARYAGISLRDYFGIEAGNKLRAFVYKLINALSLGNRDMFLDSVARMYSGLNKEIPDVIINVFADDESFKEIGYAYILGLKSEIKNNREEKTNG